MSSSSDLSFRALLLERGLLSASALDAALAAAEARGRPLERHLVETHALERDVAREVEVARSRLARGCVACRKLTYLQPEAVKSNPAPGAAEAATRCEHCGGALAAPGAPPASRPTPRPASPPQANAGPGAPRPAGPPPSRPTARPAPGAPRPAGAPAGVGAGASGPPPAQPTRRPGPVDGPPGKAGAPPSSRPTPRPQTAAQAAGPKDGGEPGAGPPQARPERPGVEPQPGAPGPRPAAPVLQVSAAPAPAPAPAAPAPAAPAPALLDDDDDGPPLPERVGAATIALLLAERDDVVVYAGALDDAPVVVRVLRPERAQRRLDVDRFVRAAQGAARQGFEPVDVGFDALGAPYLIVATSLDESGDLGARLADLGPPPAAERQRTSTDTNTNVFEKLRRQREELQREVMRASRERSRCVGRFVLLEPLGEGLGALWRGYDTSADEVVAVRVVDGGGALVSGAVAPDLEERLTLARRLRHEGLVPLREHGVDQGRIYLAREHVHAEPLHPEVALETSLQVALRVTQAIAAAHALGLAHGGLCADAVLVRHDLTVAVVDAGVAAVALRAGPPALAWRLARFGTTPPEAPLDRAPEPADDIYALGALLVRVAGPWLAPEVPALGAPPDMAGDAMAVALRCLEADPARRYAAATEVARELQAVLQGKVPDARRPLPTQATVEPEVKPSSVVGTLSGVFKRFLGRSK